MLAQRPDEREPVEARQHAVDDEDVETLVARQVQAVEAVRNLLHVMPALTQGIGEIVARLLIVLDNQNSHSSLHSSSSKKVCRRRPERPITES